VNVSIIISTYGSEKWRDLAMSRAYPSALDQGAHEIVVGHDPEGTIASVRNSLAEKATGEWLLFLDADDELAPGYLGAMQRVFEQEQTGGLPLLLTPAVSYVTARGRITPPKFWQEVDLEQANWLVIGTLVPRSLFLEVEGFPEAIHGYEDWALWAKCWKAGVRIVKVPKAIYRAHISPGSRNRRMTREEGLRWHYEIGRSIFPEQYPLEWLEGHLRRAPVRGRR